MRSENQTVTNLTELWWSADKQWLMTVNGFTQEGSDYEIFRNFCRCIKRMPHSPEAWRFQQQLKALFGEDLTFTQWYPPVLWRETAEYLLEHPMTREMADGIMASVKRKDFSTEEMDPLTGIRGTPVSLGDRRFSADHWQAYEAQTLAFCDSVYEKGRFLMLSLPRSFHAEKPDLYHVNRHLSGVERNRNLWNNQLAILLLRYCNQRGCRAVLNCGCRWTEVEALLRMAARFTPLPDLIWSPRGMLSRVGFTVIAEAVLQGREDGREGIPPVLVYQESERYPAYLPAHLCVSFL